MKKSRFAIVLLCGILSLVFLAVVETIWAVNSYRTMRSSYERQIESILEESTWKYLTRDISGSISLGNIERFYIIVGEQLRISGLKTDYRVEVLSTTNAEPITIMAMGSDSLQHREMIVDKDFTPIILRLRVDDPHSAIISNMRLTLIMQLLSIIVLSITFIYLLRTLFRAKNLEQIRRDLTHNITHELKTPIAAAYAATDALRTSTRIAEDTELRNEYLDMSLTSLRRLRDMVEEILRTSTEEFERRELNLEKCNIRDITNEVCNTLALKFKERKIEWQINIEASTEVVADRLYLLSAISALADNAIKYCTKSPIVTISSSNDNDTTTIIVKDNASGIPHSERRRIFDKFYRISQGNRHDTKGYGLGLYYVKNIVERHGGSITLRSVVDKGSEFEIKLPRYGKKRDTHS